MSRSSQRKAKDEFLNRPDGFVMVYREWFNSAAYRDLSLTARCLLMEMHILYRPGRNGALSLSVVNAAKRLNVTQRTVRPAFHELAEHGFISLTKGEYWQERKAREWRLTFLKCNGSEPTDEWRFWKPDQPVIRIGKKSPLSKVA